MKETRYLKAGAPTRCQNPACERAFDRTCIRGDNNRYYCCEVCAQVGGEINFVAVANTR